MPERLRGTRMAAAILLLFLTLGSNLILPDAARAYYDSIYDYGPYSRYRPDGSSRYYQPPRAEPETPSQPPGSDPQPPSQPPSPGVPLPGEESRMLGLLNQARTQAGLAPLRLDPLLSELARKKSQDMVDKQYFSHYSPTYGYPYNMERQAGIQAPYMGVENIGSGPDVEMAHYLLMASPGHRKNILDPRATDVGIGVVRDRTGVIVTQLFIGR